MTEPTIAIYTTLPDREQAERLAETLVGEQLVACANAFAIESIYRWEGEVTRSSEWALLLKTRATLYPRVERRIGELHPYELPAIVAGEIARGSPAYLDWIAAATAGAAGEARD